MENQNSPPFKVGDRIEWLYRVTGTLSILYRATVIIVHEDESQIWKDHYDAPNWLANDCLKYWSLVEKKG